MTVKFLVDENVDFPVVLYLRNKGYDVLAISEGYRSIEDSLILKMAFEEQRIVITNDKDFGYLVFRENIKSEGIILFRLGDQSSKAKIKVLDLLLMEHSEKLRGSFIVITENKIRTRKLISGI